jgi:hypothetical protein
MIADDLRGRSPTMSVLLAASASMSLGATFPAATRSVERLGESLKRVGHRSAKRAKARAIAQAGRRANIQRQQRARR